MRNLKNEKNYEHEKRDDRKRWERYRLTGKSVSHDAVTKWLRDLACGEQNRTG